MNELVTQNNMTINSNNIMFNPQSMDMLHSMAKVMATAVCTVPKHLQGNVGDCFAIAMQATAWGMSPYSVAQKTHLVNGVLGYEAQLVSAVITSSNAIEGHFHYEYGGDWKSDADPTSWVRVGAKIRGDQAITWGEPLYVAKVTTKNSPVWKSDPKQQGAYLALKKWSRLYTPALIMGVYTPDELVEIDQYEKEVNPLTSETPRPSKFEILKTKISELTIDQLSPSELMKHIDITGLTEEETKAIKGEITTRRRAAKEAAVVADIKPTPAPEKKPEAPKKDSEGQGKVDWHQLLSDAKDDQAALMAIMDSIPDIEMQAVFDRFTDAEFLKRCYLALPPERQDQFSGEFDLCQGFLLGVGS